MGSLIPFPLRSRRSRWLDAHQISQQVIVIADEYPRHKRAFLEVAQRARIDVRFVTSTADMIRLLTSAFEESTDDFETIDAVVVDLGLLGRTALDILMIVRERQWPVRVVVTSSLDTPNLNAQVMDLGASAFLAKPYSIGQLRRALEIIG